MRSRVTEADELIARGNRAEKAGRVQEACEHYRAAVRASPQYPKAHLNLGIALEALGDAAGAIACHEQALALDPGDPYASYNLGKLLYARGELVRARELLGQALRARPAFPEAHIVLGCVLRAQGLLKPAAEEFEMALRERPDDFHALFHQAAVLRALERPDDAQAALERALAVDPANADARAALAELLQGRGDVAGAARELEWLLRARPGWVEALYNYGSALMSLGREAPAEATLRRVIELEPGFVLAYRMLASLLHRQGRIAEALALCRLGHSRTAQSFELESFELLLLNFSDELTHDALFARHRDFGRRLEAAVPPRFTHRNSKDAQRRLRVGYVSGDFNSHPVGLFMAPVLDRHDRARYEVCCYSTSTKSDEFTRSLTARADLWRDARVFSEDELAAAIHADAVDILVDLAGHSGISRLGTFARRPAPVQVSWLGYLNTTGMTRMGYRITDAVSDPPGSERWHTETLVRLPHSQWCYRPFITVGHAAAPPSVRNGHVTFGSFAQVAKISPSTRALWRAILEQLPEARLVVLGNPDEELRRSFGDAARRVTLVPFLPLREYYASFDGVDVALDTMPYSGGTTTCDALWMGVPVISAPGTRPASRSAASILTAVGLRDWIASSPEDYVRRAVDLSKNTGLLLELRASLRGRMQASPLMDEAGFTRDLEHAYRDMWRRWCASGG